jgi:IS5 family transposase
VTADLAHRRPRPLPDGRPSTPVEGILRLLVVKHLYGWSDEATAHWVSESLGLRQFCRVSMAPVPDDTTLSRWAHRSQPATWHGLLEHGVQLARSLKVTRGRKRRSAGTVVATNLPHPTDSPVLYDGVRVLSRTLAQARPVVQQTTPLARAALRERTRRAKRQRQRLMEAARQRGAQADAQMRTAFQRLLTITTATVTQQRRSARSWLPRRPARATSSPPRCPRLSPWYSGLAPRRPDG